MVTPMRPDGSIDLEAAVRVANHLVDHGHDGIVVSGTTGESPTTTDAEKLELLRVVLDAVGNRARITAGVGTNDTRHSVELARSAANAGADGLLVVTPYYNKPSQAGIRAHFTTIADATDLPVMLYDIPGRTGLPISTESLMALGGHPRIAAVKDAKADLWGASKVMAATDLLWFSGDDVMNLAHLTQGATGVVSVVGHVAGDAYAAMVKAVDAGDLQEAIRLHRRVMPIVTAIMTPGAVSQGAVMAKAALKAIGVLDSAAVRLPLLEADDDDLASVRDGLTKAGLA
jgi:4-hydroxy-tetrahydrodipicolinate synthase